MTLSEYVAAFWRREGAREDQHRALTGELLRAVAPEHCENCDGCFYRLTHSGPCFPPEENPDRALCIGDERRDRTTIIWVVDTEPKPEVEPNPL